MWCPLWRPHVRVRDHSYWGVSCHARAGSSLFCEVSCRLWPVLEGLQYGVVQNTRVSSTGPLAGASSNPGDVPLVLVLWLCWSCFWSFLWTDFFSWFCFFTFVVSVGVPLARDGALRCCGMTGPGPGPGLSWACGAAGERGAALRVQGAGLVCCPHRGELSFPLSPLGHRGAGVV